MAAFIVRTLAQELREYPLEVAVLHLYIHECAMTRRRSSLRCEHPRLLPPVARNVEHQYFRNDGGDFCLGGHAVGKIPLKTHDEATFFPGWSLDYIVSPVPSCSRMFASNTC
jgi:hypothetical protein